MSQLQLLEGRGERKLRILDEVAHQWKDLAIALGYDYPKMDSMDQKALRDPREACREMFGHWLDGDNELQPVSWDSLVDCLINAGFVDLADRLEEIMT